MVCCVAFAVLWFLGFRIHLVQLLLLFAINTATLEIKTPQLTHTRKGASVPKWRAECWTGGALVKRLKEEQANGAVHTRENILSFVWFVFDIPARRGRACP